MTNELESDTLNGSRDVSASIQEEASMITHAEMLGKFYRNEITREELWQLERLWANGLGKPLPPSDLDRAKEVAAREGTRHWTWDEEQKLPAKQLLARARQRAEDYRAQRPLSSPIPLSVG